MPYINGEVCYKLRCAFLHSGNADVANKYSDFTLDNFTLVVQPKNQYDIYGDSVSRIEDSNGNVVSTYEVNIRRLCLVLKCTAEGFLKKCEDKLYVIPDIKIKFLGE